MSVEIYGNGSDELRHEIVSAFIAGYEKGHNDTVEGQYGYIEESADEYADERMSEGKS